MTKSELLVAYEIEKAKRIDLSKKIKIRTEKHRKKIRDLQEKYEELEKLYLEQRKQIQTLRFGGGLSMSERKELELLRYGITMSHEFFMRIKQSAVAKDVLKCAGLTEPPK